MYDEMRFLFDVDPNIKNINNKAEKNQVVNDADPAQSIEYREELDDLGKNFTMNKYVINKGNTKNFIQSDVNKFYGTSNLNPYLELIKEFNKTGTAKSLKLKSSHFAYLRDIGVMPINRLMILRRYPVGVVVPVDLSDLKTVEPISVVIGWVKKDTNLLNFTFNEKWQKQGSGDMLHLMLNKIIKDEFGLDMSAIMPIPGWGLGFMFGILNKMGLTSYDRTNLPIGNPNVLKESITRPHEEQGIDSSFSFEMETVYEQKYIAGLDPTVSTLELLNNLLMMGTSDMQFLGKKGSEIEKQLRVANENPTNGAGWASLIGTVVDSFTKALKESLTELKTDFTKFASKPPDESNPPATTTTGDASTKATDSKKNESQKSLEKVGFLDQTLDNPIIKTILASTLARYQWPLRGSISMFTGDATTPWHLTIGNPYAPLLSMNNIYVKTVAVTFGKDMGHNDMPRIMEVKVSMEQGRSLGKQEIYKLFGVSYKRWYNKTK